MNLSICIITCNRPKGLQALLEALNQLRLPDDAPSIKIVVVDNDAEQSAREVAEGNASLMRWPLEYYVEEHRGIPFARNTCLEKSQDADLIAFIDDDEIPDKDWLKVLLFSLSKHNADVVTGPCRPQYPPSTPAWVVKGDFFSGAFHDDGAVLGVSFTNNVCFKRTILNDLEPWFDERMALSGGSDSHFFRRVVSKGFKIVWASNALVYEEVPTSRSNASWLVKRSFRVGTMMTISRFDISNRMTAGVITIASALRWCFKGIVTVIPGLVLGKHIFIKGLTHFFYAAGIIAGVTGQKYQEYKQIHGE